MKWLSFRYGFLFWALWLFSPISLYAQPTLYIENITGKTSLPEGAVNCLAQDDDGFLWIGTWKGLYRYDGYDVLNFTSINPAFNAMKIEEMIIHDNHLWVGTFVSGLYRIDLSTYQVTRYHQNAESSFRLSDNNIISLCRVKENMLLVGSERGGLSIIDSTGCVVRQIRYEEHPEILINPQVSKISRIDDDRVVLGNNGILILDLNTFETQHLVHPLFENHISEIAVINEKEFLVSTLEGLFHFYADEGNYRTELLVGHRIRAILELKNTKKTTFLMGTQDGIAQYTAEDRTMNFIRLSDPKKNPKQNITSLIYSHDNVILIGSENGLFSLIERKQQFNSISTHNPQNTPDIISQIEITDRNFYAGSWGKGLLKLNPQSRTLEALSFSNYTEISPQFIFSLREIEGNIWFSTKNYLGIFRFADGLPPYQLHYYSHFIDEKNQWKKYTVTSILEKRNGDIILGTWEGILFYLDEKNDRFKPLKDPNSELPLSENMAIFSLLEDHEGYIWVGINGGGVVKMNISDETILSQECITDKNGLTSNFVTAVYQSRNNKIWIGTEAGLNVYENNTFTHAYHKDIVFDVQSIIEDPIGFLWLGTQKGLVRINSNNLQEPHKLFDNSDGLQNQSFYLNSVLNDEEYNYYFGGYQGIDYFTPYKIEYNYNKPRPQITNFILFNERMFPCTPDMEGLLEKNIFQTDALRLKHMQNTFSFEFSNLEYQLPEKCQFAFQLEGVDNDWNYRDAFHRTAYYTKLQPGNYIFRVKSTNNDGVWCDYPLELKIIIAPPFWATTWAILIYFVVAMFSIFFLLYLRIVKVQEKHNQQLLEVEYRKQKELDELKLRFFTNISHEFRTPLTLIMGPLTQILEKGNYPELKDPHLMIFRNASRLLQLTNRIMDFRKSENDQLKLKVEATNVSDFIYNIFLFFNYEAQMRHIDYRFKTLFDQTIFIDKEFVESTTFNLISNAFKYTPDGKSIYVKVFPDEQWLKISVSDTGIGIPEERKKHIFDRFHGSAVRNSAGIGLSFSKKLIEMHKGDIIFTSQEGLGSEFILQLPLTDVYRDDEKSNPSSRENITDWKKIDQNTRDTHLSNVQILKSTFEKDELIVLVADDNFEIRQFIKGLLQNEFTIIEAQNGKQALEEAFDTLPDLVISDIMMPEMDGLELCERLKTDERTDHIPVILTTVLSSQTDRIEGLQRGADSYIPKPIDPKHLLVRVHKLIERQLKLKEKFNLSDYTTTKKTPPDSDDPDRNPLVEKARKIVLQNLDNSEYNIDDFCSDLGLSRMQLYRKFKAITGMSANSFIRKVRLHKAAEMLRSGDYTVKEVTYDVGFIDLKYFRKCFHEEFGINPSEYAQNNNSVHPDE
ncbi:MAG TPA: two-component regulator propeller domain-containing protein [Prolixibacteraceae bacterium]|nr:two-component regulator propeller domain-containing protein [Prolixibacteraceae bacterium]